MGKKYKKDQGESNERRNFNRHRNGDKDQVENKAKTYFLYVSLEDFLKGGKRNMSISRTITQTDGKIIREDKVFTVHITPGMRSGTKVVFHKEGDQTHGESPADIAIIIKHKRHNLFIREGSNIKYVLKLSLKEALNGTTAEIPTLTGEKITVNLTPEVITPKIVKRIQGHGLPFLKDPSSRGDLLLFVDIIYPEISTLGPDDFYQILGIDKDTSDAELTKAYNILSLWRQPGQNQIPSSEEDFKKIFEAYKILSNTKGKQEFNNFGHQNAATNDCSGQRMTKNQNFAEEKRENVFVSLEELLLGCTKEKTIIRRIIKHNGSVETELKTFTILIKPGTREGAYFFFSKQGDQHEGQVPRNVIFIIKNQPHALFVREGSNIRYTREMSMMEVVTSTCIEIPTLTGEKIRIDLTKETIMPNITKRFSGYGLPFLKEPSRKGILVVSLKIKFPDVSNVVFENLFETLGIEDNATHEEITRAYLILNQWYHRDRNRKPGFEKNIKRILEAHEILTNKERRNDYENNYNKDANKEHSERESPHSERESPKQNYRNGKSSRQNSPNRKPAAKESPNRESPKNEFSNKEHPREEFSYKEHPKKDFLNKENPKQEFPNKEHPKQEFTNKEHLKKDFLNSDDPKRDFSNSGFSKNSGNEKSKKEFSNTEGSKKESADGENRTWNKDDPQDSAVYKHLYVSLEEVLEGCTKKMKIWRNVLYPSRRREEKEFIINVKPGWKAGTKIIFEKESDQYPGRIPANIVFIIKDKIHPVFQRDGSDIKYTKILSLKKIQDFHCNNELNIVEIPTLNQENIMLQLTEELIRPNKVKRIRGHGLPFINDSTRKGDLLLTFDVKFPESFNESCKDFYKILGVYNNATTIQIRNAYRLLDLWYNPKNNPNSLAKKTWQIILEAYGILSDPKKREVYDKNSKGPDGGRSSSGSFNKEQQRQEEQRFQDPAINHDLHITLEEILNGCTKMLKITRKVIHPNGITSREDKLFTITIKPGWKAGTKIIFEKEGNQCHGRIPSDIVFIIRDKPHPLFKRNSSDITYSQKLFMKQVVSGTFVEIPTLTGEKIDLKLTAEMVNPKMVKQFPGHGLPFPKEPSRKGDLLVTFEVEFPEISKRASHPDYIKDLHCVLCINEGASVDEIRKAYKTLALWYHPDRNRSPGSEEKFKKILEAYEVLTKAKKAKDKLKNDSPKTEHPTKEAPNSGFPKKEPPNSGFSKQEPPNSGFYQSTTGDNLPQDPPREYDLYVTLEEVFTGCTKRMKISRNVLQPDGRIRKEDKILIVDVKPGWKAGTKITFKKEGDQCRGRIPGDIVFVIQDKPHPLLKRDGSNVIFNKRLSFYEAVRDKFIGIRTLNNEFLYFSIVPENVKPGNVRKYEGRGLPFPKEPWLKGDLLVSVDIQYPEICISNYKSFYEILGINSSADSSEIKLAYQLLDQWYRLDKNRKPGWAEKLKKISEVYAVLSDYRKREIYNNFGEEGLKRRNFW